MIIFYAVSGFLILVALVIGMSIGRGLGYSEMKCKAKDKGSIHWQGMFYQVRVEGEMLDLERCARAQMTESGGE